MNGWIAVQGHIVGNVDKWGMCYHWDGQAFPSKQQAITRGFKAFDSDDFNVGRIENGVLVWWGWMDEQHPQEDYAEVAEELGLRVEWA